MSECKHEKLKLPEFDEKEARTMTAPQIKRKWPRAVEKCPDCQETVVSYASYAHYIFGDW